VCRRPLARPRSPEGPVRYVARIRSWGGGGGPEEAGEFAGDGDGGDVVGLAALTHPVVDLEEPVLSAPGDLQDVIGLPGLTVRSVAPILGGRM
jgi:hypothetical protein